MVTGTYTHTHAHTHIHTYIHVCMHIHFYLMTAHAIRMNHGGLFSLPSHYFTSSSISVSTVIAALGETLLGEELAQLWWFGNRRVERK